MVEVVRLCVWLWRMPVLVGGRGLGVAGWGFCVGAGLWGKGVCECVLKMEHQSLCTHLQVKQFTQQLSEAPLVCVDGNVPNDTIEFVCNFCSNAGIPGTCVCRVRTFTPS